MIHLCLSAYIEIKGHVSTVKGHMTRAAHFLFVPREHDDSDEAFKEKCVNMKTGQRFLVQFTVKVSSVAITPVC